MNVYAVIMAGGVGARLWPRSREKSPKQLLHILGEGSMLQNTIARLQPLIPYQNILIVTSAAQAAALMQQVPQIPPENIIIEPFGRNTAPCVALAGGIIAARDPQGVMVVLPADHWIANVGEFQHKLQMGCQAAWEMQCLVTMGIQPTRPETGYGYIQWSDEREQGNRFYDEGLRPVYSFAEKPDRPTAERFLESGDFLWNSGMFIWRTDVIDGELGRYLPELHEQMQAVWQAVGTPQFESILDRAYRRIHPISIDYGVMEKADKVYVVHCEFGWSDVGSWDEALRLARSDADGNVIQGEAVTVDTVRSFISTDGKMIATVGVEDLIVIDTPDALLICKRGQSQRVQAVVDYLRRKKITGLL